VRTRKFRQTFLVPYFLSLRAPVSQIDLNAANSKGPRSTKVDFLFCRRFFQNIPRRRFARRGPLLCDPSVLHPDIIVSFLQPIPLHIRLLRVPSKAIREITPSVRYSVGTRGYGKPSNVSLNRMNRINEVESACVGSV
jgi:hypothetical protein